ncbi:MAG: hypothetical protein GX670_01890, partial [Bacteroidales bacterium]|nr:hypothetical protein [Bacteroidales bacterium]
MRKLLYIAFLANLIFAGCRSEDILGEKQYNKQNDKNIEISFSISEFKVSSTTSRSTRATQAGSAAEQQITNLYLFLFDAGGANPIKYYVDNSFSNGQWNTTEGKITLELTQAEAGTSQVYLVANVSPIIKTTLDGVSTLAALKAVKSTVNTPWSSTLTTPILMSGNATHNFVTNRILSSVPLTRALAKIELNVTLPAKHQDAAASHYRYNFIDFDKNTYVLKPTAKTDELVTSGWQAWQAASTVSSYTLTGGKVANLKVITNINERDNPGSYIDIKLPYNQGGPL